MFNPPDVIEAEIFTTVPKSMRKTTMPQARIDAGRGVPKSGAQLEGPGFDRDGNLYFVDASFGRIFRASPKGEVEEFIEYDGEPNGLRIHRDGRIFIADYQNGIMLLDPATRSITPLVSRYLTEHFKGVNDLTFSKDGDLYFTDQGQSDLTESNGAVYCLTAAGPLRKVIGNAPSPNGLVLSVDEKTLYLAVTRANAIWRLPFTPIGTVARMGLHIQMSGGTGPDGIAVDESGGLAIAHPGMGAVWIFNARGEPIYRINTPGGERPTNITYGGPDRKTLYITESGTASIYMARLPVAGKKLFAHT